MGATALEHELILARMKSIQYESSLLRELVQLQRMRIEQLERKARIDKELRVTRLNLKEYGVCRNCGSRAPDGQTFCTRACMYEAQRAGIWTPTGAAAR